MDFALTERCQEYQERLWGFMNEHVIPNEDGTA